MHATDSSASQRPAWLAIAGPTASGKTALALALAQRWPVEIISVDSALVFRGMDIGTAKPSAGELAAVPHHLIDIRDPLDVYSAAEFMRDARQLLGEIRRGRLPLLVGGTMLYFKGAVRGFDEMPAADPGLRARDRTAGAAAWLAGAARAAGRRSIRSRPTAWRPNDSQRIQRALEVWRACGPGRSSFHTRTRPRLPRGPCRSTASRAAARARTGRARLAARPHRRALRRHAGAGLRR